MSGLINTTPEGSTEDQSWMRLDGTKKGQGFLGPMKAAKGKTSTEISIGVNFDGKQMEIPALVPTLTRQEIDYLLKGGTPTPEIVQKASQHAIERMKQGLPVFAP